MAIAYKEEALPAVSTFAFDINRWAGVNKIKGSQYDYEMADCKNMSSDSFPYASPRKPREKLIDEQGIKRIYKVDGNKIYYIDSDDYLCYCENGVKSYVTDSDGNQIQRPNVTCTNNYDMSSIFYPGISFINEDDEVHTSSHRVQFVSYSDLFGFKINKVNTQGMRMVTTVPIDNADVTEFSIKVEFPSEDDMPFPINSKYENAFTVQVTQISIEGISVQAKILKFKADDYTDDTQKREKTWNVDFTEFTRGDYLEFKVYYSMAGDASEVPSTYWKEMMEFIKVGTWSIEGVDEKGNPCDIPIVYGVVYNNRIIGVKGNDIRASALGDFANFWEYADEAGNPSATGAYATDVGSAGDFTGICAYNNVLLLFKKDIVYEMYGSMPYTITELCTTGCIDNDSIASIDGVLYWASPKGIVRYSGGVPNVISTQIDIHTDGICKAGTDGRKYYVYDGYKTFVYDTYYQIWHIEDETPVKMRYNHINDLYMVCDDGIYKAASGKEAVEWEFTTKDYTFASAERKNLSKLWIRADMQRNSRLEIYVRQNGGEWSRVAVKTAENDEMFDFKLRVKKCDSYTLKFKGKGDVRILDIHGKVTVGTSKHRSGASLNVYRK